MQVDVVAGLLQRDDARLRGFPGDGKAQRDVRPPLKVHRDEDLGLDGHDEIARARVVHAALTGIDREKCHVDLLLGNRRDAVVERALGGFDFRDGGFVPPVPQVQVARVEQRDARKIDVERNAIVRRAVGVHRQRAERARLAGGHAHALVGLRNVKPEDIGCVFAAQIVDRRGKVIVVVMTDKHVQLFKRRERRLIGQSAPIRAGFAGVKEQAGAAERNEEAASP